MVKLYADRIEAGKMKIEEVPSYWREDVRLELERRQQIELGIPPQTLEEPIK